MPPPPTPRRWFGRLLVAVPILLLAERCWDDFNRFGSGSPQSECKSILKSFLTSEKAYYAEKDQYSEDACAIGFQPERANRYAYFLGLGGTTEVRDQDSLPLLPPGCGRSAIGVDTFRWGARWAVGAERLPPLLERARPGVSGVCPRCEVAGACVGWIPLYHRTPLWVRILGEPEKGLDAWSISTRERRLPDGGVVAPGEPWNDLNALAPPQADHR